jgi:CRISPR system Cascade subunit CasA
MGADLTQAPLGADWQPATSPRFNLLDEPWVPVRASNGEQREVGLRTLLAESRNIEALSAASALVETAVLRLVAALLCHAHQGPRDRQEWRALWDAPSLVDPVVDGYLTARHGEFFLLDPDRPFAQTSAAHLLTSSHANEKSLAELSHHRASGTGKRLFDKSRDDVPLRCTPAEAARMLIAYQCWAPGGGTGYGSSRLAGGVLVCVPTGRDLHETVLLNMTAYDPGAGEPIAVTDGDAPSWERDRSEDTIGADRPVDGLVDLLTRRPRAASLLTDSEGRLGRVLIAAGERIPGDSTVRDPNIVYRLTKGAARAHKLPLGAPAWTELPALLAARSADAEFHCTLVRWAGLTRPEVPQISWRALALDSTQALTRSVADAQFQLPVRIADEPARRLAVDELVASVQRTSQLLGKYFAALGRRGRPGDRQRDAKAHEQARRAAHARADRAFWGGASTAFAAAMATVCAETISESDAISANTAWRAAVRACVDDAVRSAEALTGGSVVALMDAGEARAALDSRLGRTIGTPIAEIYSKEGT